MNGNINCPRVFVLNFPLFIDMSLLASNALCNENSSRNMKTTINMSSNKGIAFLGNSRQ